MAAPLSPELLAQKGVKTLPVRKGDSVRVVRGDHKGFEGKVSRVDLKKYRIYLEGLTREKVDGSTIPVPLHPSKVMIRNLNLDDKTRKAILERKKLVTKKPEKPAKKTANQEKTGKKKPAADQSAATIENPKSETSEETQQTEQKTATENPTTKTEGGT
jgi:large subunit ribosomal protein L24